MFYTLGQRRGLGIGGGGNGQRWFVVEKDLANNRLIVEQGDDMQRLYAREAEASQPSWIAGQPPVADGEEIRVKVRLRHRQPLQSAVMTLEGSSVRFRFEQPQRAVTPGQAAVVYVDETCLGGATVDAGK